MAPEAFYSGSGRRLATREDVNLTRVLPMAVL
jgi:hypothetical protein